MTGSETQKNLQAQRGFTTEPPGFCTAQAVDAGSGFYFCMKATWHAASLMKFLLSIISNLQGCCHPRGSKQQGFICINSHWKQQAAAMSPSSCRIQNSNELPPNPAAKRWEHQGQNSLPTSEHQSSLKQGTNLGSYLLENPHGAARPAVSGVSGARGVSPAEFPRQPQQLSLPPLWEHLPSLTNPHGAEGDIPASAPPEGLISNPPAPTQGGLSSIKRFLENWFFPATSSHVGVGWEEWGCAAGGTSILW